MFSFGLPDFPASKQASTPPSVPMEEDAQKRHTDCIYFLASPRTCKKGNNCDFRHSEAARTNPRDCRFWKCGNCLNAQCSFRHLPLEASIPAAISTGTTMPKAMAMTVGLIKCKTPCYFFSQGNCAKGDKCTFMHGVPVASSTAEAPVDQNHVSGVKTKAVHTSGRPSVELQRGIISEEGRPVNIRSCEVLDEGHPFPSRAPESVPGVLEKVATTPFAKNHYKESEKSGDKFCDAPDLVDGSRQLKATKKTQQVQDNGQRFIKINHLIHKNDCQSKALWKDAPSGLYQSLGGQKVVHSLHSDRKISQGLSKVPAHDGQNSEAGYSDCKEQKEESEGNPRSQSMKRMKVDGSIYSSAGQGSHPGLASQQCGSGKRHNVLLKQRRQLQGGNNWKVAMEAGFDTVKGAKLSKGASLYPPPKALSQSLNNVQSKSKQPVVAVPKAASISDIRLRVPSGLASKSSTSENVKETLDFTGPKSLAQIKAEKMAAREVASKAFGSARFSSVMSESASNVGIRTSAVSADAVTSDDNLLRLSPSTIKKDSGLNQLKCANCEELEGQVETPLKRKREEKLGTNKTETVQGSHALAQVLVLPSFREIEDREFCGDDKCNEDDGLQGCTSVPSEEDIEVMSPSMPQSSSEEVQEEGLEFEVDSLEDVPKLDLDMEESAFTVEDYEIDDDDEDDFAKKLGRFFGLSSNE